MKNDLYMRYANGIHGAPYWLLRYIAPMGCGERERAELCRRIRETKKEEKCSTPSV